MGKGEQTRIMILERSAPVFNQLGYAGAALSDIMSATGLEKGGIYNHFSNKEELALAAFDWSLRQMGKAMIRAMRGHEPGLDRLKALISSLTTYFLEPPVPGGCPLLNAAVDSDDAHPALRVRTQVGMDQWRALVRSQTEAARERKEIGAEVDAAKLADLIVASSEGGVMLSQLYGDVSHIQNVAAHLCEYLSILESRRYA